LGTDVKQSFAIFFSLENAWTEKGENHSQKTLKSKYVYTQAFQFFFLFSNLKVQLTALRNHIVIAAF
jgi:hypothetical protein